MKVKTMAKTICASCGKSKGNRSCLLLQNEIICPVCCVAKRNEQCLGCEHYLAAKRMEMERYRSTGKHPFVLNMTHEDEIDAVLARLEKSKDGNWAAAELEKYQDMTSHFYCFAKGVIFLFLDAPEEAVPFFHKAVSLFPYFSAAWYNLSSALMKCARIPEAYDACRILLNLSGPDSKFYAMAKDRIREMEEFTEQNTPFSLQEYIERMKRFEHYYSLIPKDPQQAANGFLELLEKEPDHVQSHGNLGICYSFLGRKADAERELRKALELDPGYDIARTNLHMVAKMQEGIPLPESHQCSYLGMEFYKQKLRLENSHNPVERQAIRELFALCGIKSLETASDDQKK
jgi:tetratricopeptide (TPR) repeat protein